MTVISLFKFISIILIIIDVYLFVEIIMVNALCVRCLILCKYVCLIADIFSLDFPRNYFT